MVDLAGHHPGAWAPAPRVLRGTGQRLFWHLYDIGLAVALFTAAGDMPNRWGLTSALWLLIYGMTVLRVLSVWPAFFRLLARNWVYLIYPAVCALSLIWSLAWRATLVSSIQLTMTVMIACYLGWRFSPRHLVFLVFSTFFVASLGSVLNWSTGIFQPLYSNVGGLLGIYTNKNMLGHYSLFALLIAMNLALSTRDAVPAPLRAISPLAVALCAVLVVMSKSMTAIVLMPLYAGLVLLLNRRRLPGWSRHLAIMLIVPVVALAPLFLSLAGIDPLANLLAATGKDATLTGRTELWALAAQQIARAPLTGLGYGAVWVAPDFEALRFAVLRAGATAPSFHDFLADVGVGTGLLGIGAILATGLTTLARAFQAWRADGSSLSVCWLITALLPINVGLVEPYLYRQHEFMLSWVIMLGVSLGQRRDLLFPSTPKARPRP